MTLHKPSDNGNHQAQGDNPVSTPESAALEAWQNPLANMAANSEMVESAKASWFGPAIMSGELTEAHIAKMTDPELHSAIALSDYVCSQRASEVASATVVCNNVATLKDEDLRPQTA